MLKTAIAALLLCSQAYSDVCTVTLKRPGVADVSVGTFNLPMPNGNLAPNLYVLSDFKDSYILSTYGKVLENCDIGYEIAWALPLKRVGTYKTGWLSVTWQWGRNHDLYPVVFKSESPVIGEVIIDCSRGSAASAPMSK